MHWTLFALDSDPAHDYMYTYPASEAEDRNAADGPDAPELLAPLIRDGIEHAFRLAPLTGPEFRDVKRKTDETDILLRDGKPDLLPGIYPKPVYTDGKYSQKFLLCGGLSEAERVRLDSPGAWYACISRLQNYLDSAMDKMRIVTSIDRGFFRRGSCCVNVTELKDRRAIITVTATVEPYKYERYHSAEPWVWADFSFVDGIIREYGAVTVTHDAGHDYMTFSVPVRGKDIVPKFRRGAVGDAVDAVQVSTDGEHWTDCAFAEFAPADDPAARFAKALTLEGARRDGQERTLYLRGAGKTIGIRLRGGTR